MRSQAGKGRPYVFLLTPGNVADISVAPLLVAALFASALLIADMGYDANCFRQLLEERKTEAIIPSTLSRTRSFPLDAGVYRQRNVIERMFGRLTDFRRIATRYDKLARNVLAGLCLTAAIEYSIA